MKKKKFLGAMLLALWSNIAFSQQIFLPDSIKKTVQPVKINTNITIDGALTEPEWRLAAMVDKLVETDPLQGIPAKKTTIVKLMYNKNYLYLGVVCYDTVGRNRYRTLNLKRDFSASNSDFFAVAVDGYNDERNCIMFGMNPYGGQRDLLSFDDTYVDPDWDGLWTVRTQRTDTAWISEVAIPWKTIRYKKEANATQTMGISFGRIARSINESSNWPAIPRAFDGLRMPYAAKLVNVETPPPATNIKVIPYTLFSHTRTYAGSVTENKNMVKPGGDLTWSITPNSVLNVTLNTDFAQADVDMIVNNINRFSVLYPEKRQFFLENSGLFAAGLNPLGVGLSDYSTIIQPFFSRSIGLGTNGTPLGINGGARFVYRSNTQSIGGLFINQDGTDSASPANFLLTRYSKNVGAQNRIGGMLYKTQSNSNGQTGVQNLTGSVDGFFRFGQSLSWSNMISVTNDKPTQTGYAASSQLLYNSNTLVWWYNQSVVTQSYNPEMGFVARGNALVTDPGFQYQLRGKWLPEFVRAIVPGASFTFYHNVAHFRLTDRYLNINPVQVQFQDGSVLSYTAVITRQFLDNAFTPLGVTIKAGAYNYIRHKVSFSSDLSRKFAAEFVLDAGGYYNGSYNNISGAVSFAPVPYFYISPKLQWGRLNHVGAEGISKNITLFALQQRMALNPRVQLSGIYQRSGINHAEGWNVRFSWEFKPLSYLYLVYNSNNFEQGPSVKPITNTNQQFIAKLSYLKQF